MEKQETEINELVKGLKVCPECKAINRDERYCHNCGKDLLRVVPYEEQKQEETRNYKMNCEKIPQRTNGSEEKNRIAHKFIVLSIVVKVFGYVGAVIAALAYEIILSGKTEDDFTVAITALVIGAGLAFGTWFTGLIYDAIAEVINLLQDIKNK